MTGEFDPARYKDEYREALEAVIESKVEGKEIVEVEEPEETGKLIDLMAALEASVSAAKAARESGDRKPVSVSEAKAAKEAKAEEAKTARRRSASRSDEDEEAPAKPARKRKTA
jgi:DNA end-binding protein Ku